MNLRDHFRMTASEQVLGRFLRAPDHPATPETIEQANDQFAAAFADLTSSEPSATEPEAKTPAEPEARAVAAEPEAKTPAAEPEAETVAIEPEAKAVAAEPEAKTPAAEPEAKAAAEPEAKALVTEELSDAEADKILKDLAKRVKATPVEEPAPAAETPAAEEAPVYTDEEQQFLDAHEKEWGEMSRGEALKRRAEYRAVMNHVFDQVTKVLKPIIETQQVLAARAQLSDIKAKVGDYTDDDRQKVVDWVKTQPTYLQTAYMDVIEGGTADEVADLFGRYREASGLAPAASTAEAPRGETELSDAAKKAAEALAPVSSKRSVVREPDDKSDFDGAWDKFSSLDVV